MSRTSRNVIVMAVLLCLSGCGTSPGTDVSNPGKGNARPSTPLYYARMDFGTADWPRCVAIGDLNQDGKPDLAVANWLSENISVPLGNGNGIFQDARNYGVGNWPWSTATGDYNGDGATDIGSVNYGTNSISVLFHTPRGG